MGHSRTTSWTAGSNITCTTAATRLTRVTLLPDRASTASVFVQLFNGGAATAGTTAPDLVLRVPPAGGTALTSRQEAAVYDCGGLYFDTGLVAQVTVTSTGAATPTATFAPDSLEIWWSGGE